MKKHKVTIQLLESMAHGDTSSLGMVGNTSLFMRRNQIVHGLPTLVPCISSNSLRSTMFRKPLHDHLMHALGIDKGMLNQSTVNLLWAGGDLKKGAKSPARENELGYQVFDNYPSLALLGGSVDNFMLPRSYMNVCSWIVCQENADTLRVIAPELEEDASNYSAFDLIAETTRTAGTSLGTPQSNKIFTYETLAAGAKIVIELTLSPLATELHEACLAHAINYWDGFIGGKNSSGHGKSHLLTSTLTSAESYLTFIDENREAMRDGLVAQVNLNKEGLAAIDDGDIGESEALKKKSFVSLSANLGTNNALLSD